MHPLASSAITALVRNSVASRAQGAVVSLTLPVACGFVSALLGLAALAMLAVALWNGLLPELGLVWTPVAVAGALLVLAAIPVLIVWIRARRRRAEQQRRPDIDEMLSPILDQARSFTRDHQGTTLFTAIAAGVAAGLANRD